MVPALDEIDYGILCALQENAREPITDIADELNVSDNTVRNRIKKLETNNVIRRYSIDLNYNRADVQHFYLFICTVRVSKREEIAERIRSIPGVIEVMTVMTGTQNMFVKVAGVNKTKITNIAYQLDDLELDIEREHMIWDCLYNTFTEFEREEGQE